MANTSLFNSLISRILPVTDHVNAENSPAYQLDSKAALAQYAVTGCLNSTYYANAEEQLVEVLSLSKDVEPEFIAKLAIYSRQEGRMKDMPALLCAILSTRDVQLLKRIFPRVLNNGKLIRNFVQMIRSGRVGRRSLGSAPKRLITEWLEERTETELIQDSIGGQPSLADVIKLVHPTPKSEARAALYAYFLGKEPQQIELLPAAIQDYEAFKMNGKGSHLPEVPFQMLTSMELSSEDWVEIAKRASWQMTRMNLNTFARNGVFKFSGLPEMIAQKLSHPLAIRKAGAFPYQIMSSWKACNSEVPEKITNALEEAMEIAISDLPFPSGKIFVCPDVSGSMQSPVTGWRNGATTVVRCIDVAALMASAFLRNHSQTEVIPFAEKVITVELEQKDRVMVNAQKLAAIGGGGTHCSAPLELLNRLRIQGDLILLISDNQSWVDRTSVGASTSLMREWQIFKRRNPGARMVCLDIQPYGNSQARDSLDILNIGGFSDTVFDIIRSFSQGELIGKDWSETIEENVTL